MMAQSYVPYLPKLTVHDPVIIFEAHVEGIGVGVGVAEVVVRVVGGGVELPLEGKLRGRLFWCRAAVENERDSERRVEK